MTDTTPPAPLGEDALPVATIKRGAQTPWGFAGLLVQWESGLQDLPPGECKVYAQAQLSTLRDQVARLERERDEAREERDDLGLDCQAAHTALKAASLDVEMVMALAESLAGWHYAALASGTNLAKTAEGHAREALRAALTAKE